MFKFCWICLRIGCIILFVCQYTIHQNKVYIEQVVFANSDSLQFYLPSISKSWFMCKIRLGPWWLYRHRKEVDIARFQGICRFCHFGSLSLCFHGSSQGMSRGLQDHGNTTSVLLRYHLSIWNQTVLLFPMPLQVVPNPFSIAYMEQK